MRGALAVLLAGAALGQGAGACLAGEVPRTSDGCGECHKEIYGMWRVSAHARSMEDPVFLAAYRQTEEREAASVSRLCLKCHAPLAELTGDPGLAKKRTWEGVNCDVCHSLVSVDMSGFGPRQVFDLGDVKRGPIPDAASSAHEVAYSELHATPLVCAGCHEFTNSEGTPVMTTYTEWKESAAARQGKTCQTCHMSRVRAAVVDPKIARVQHAEVNVHEVPGGHSLDQLHKALSVALDPKHVGDSLWITVRLTNKGAGHAVPTGMPGRRVILDVHVRTSDGATFDDNRVYERFFLDATGRRVTEVSRYFTGGVRVEADSRILADERRVETFSFPVPASATAYLNVRLLYEHAPMAMGEGRTLVTFYSERRTLSFRGAGAQ